MAYYNNNFPNNTGYQNSNYSYTGYNGGQQQYNTGNNPMSLAIVNGEEGAMNYPVAAGNTVLLVDFNSHQFWLKSTASNGVPQQLRNFSFEEHTPKVEPVNGNNDYYVTKKELEDLRTHLDNQFNDIKSKFYRYEGNNHSKKSNKEDN